MRKLLLSRLPIGLATPAVATGCRFTMEDLPESEGGQIGPNSFLVVLDFEHIKFDDGRICALALDDFGGHVACKGDPDPEGRPLLFAGKSPHDQGISLVIYGSSVWYLDNPHCVIPQPK